MSLGAYSDEFYAALRGGALRSARVILPLVIDLVQPSRVVDVGCGTGTWLAALIELGITDVLGVDGGAASPASLEIPAERFLARDLREPLAIGRGYDLALSLEVGEHLPPECASAYVGSLAALAPAVLFSAAIPDQGGTGHVNEQWPEYWAELFAAHGFLPVDCLRRRIWRHPDVEWWYAQNVLIYAERSYLQAHPRLQREYDYAGTAQLSVVHPRKYEYLIEWARTVG